MSLPPPRRLLVRGVNWLGDAVMTTPALGRLREALPSTHIALLTRAKLAGLWSSHPALNQVITIEPGESVLAVGRKLRAGSFDTALILPNSPRSALEMWLAGIPHRIGYARPWRDGFMTRAVPLRPGHVRMRKRRAHEIKRLVRPAGPHLLSGQAGAGEAPSPDAGRPAPDTHQMHDYLHLAATLGASDKPQAPTLVVRDSEVDAVLAKFAIPRQGLWLGVNAGAEYGPAKRWPQGRFVEAVTAIHRQTGCRCLVFGGPGDRVIADGIASDLRTCVPDLLNLTGLTSLRELMALLAHCRVVLTNDTGPMHIAAALGVPVVVPFGSTSPELTGPGLPGDPRHRLLRSDAPCAPCFLRECPIDFRCMNGIATPRVVDAVMAVLADA